jgi:mannan endo-1,4-beta-mannosidase
MATRKSKTSKSKILRIFIVLLLLIIPSALLFSKISSSQPDFASFNEPVAEVVKPPLNGAFLGVSTYNSDFSEIISLEKSLDKNFTLVGIYQSWGESKHSFNINWARQVSNSKKIPFITWEPWKPVGGFDRSETIVRQDDYLLKNIAGGKFDPYIRTYARSIKSFKKPVMIRFAHEMNGNWYSWGSTFNKPSEYIASWRHVHEIFKAEGASNVTWVWSPNALYIEPRVPFADKIKEFYPGDEYVDWVGLSAFNWAGRYKNNTYQEPKELYSQTVSVLESFNKPILITETASADTNNPQGKARWISNLAAYLKANPKIKGVIWFNIEDNGINWKINSTPASAESFKESFGDYFFQEK